MGCDNQEGPDMALVAMWPQFAQQKSYMQPHVPDTVHFCRLVFVPLNNYVVAWYCLVLLLSHCVQSAADTASHQSEIRNCENRYKFVRRLMTDGHTMLQVTSMWPITCPVMHGS